MTNRELQWDNAVRISSAIPSAKYSCSGSPDILVKGSTAIEGLSGSRGAVAVARRHCVSGAAACW